MDNAKSFYVYLRSKNCDMQVEEKHIVNFFIIFHTGFVKKMI